MPTVAVTDTTFQSVVLESELPVLVDFWAEWCAPCRQLAPILEKIADDLADRLVVAKVDIERNPMIAQALRVQKIPTMYLFVGGRPVDAVQGALGEAQLRQLVAPHLPPPQEGGTLISVEALSMGLDAGRKYTIVDIRAPVDFARSHLRRAKNIVAEEVVEEIPKLGGRNPIVLVCRTGEKSKEIAESMEEGPFTVMALEKGLLEWEGEGNPTYSNKEEAALETAEA